MANRWNRWHFYRRVGALPFFGNTFHSMFHSKPLFTLYKVKAGMEQMIGTYKSAYLKIIFSYILIKTDIVGTQSYGIWCCISDASIPNSVVVDQTVSSNNYN